MPQSHTWQPLSMFPFLCFCLITSKFEFQREARCSQHWLQLLEPELSMNTITKITYNPRLVSIIEKWLGWAPLPYSWLFWQALKLANWSLIWRIRVRRTWPRCALLCTIMRAIMCVVLTRARAHVFGGINFGDLVKNVKIPTKFSGYTILQWWGFKIGLSDTSYMWQSRVEIGQYSVAPYRIRSALVRNFC